MGKSGVKQMIRDMEEVAFMERAEAVRFTVTLTERDNRRLEYLARRYGLKRAEMARQLLVAAMDDAEDTLGLAVVEDKDYNGMFAVTDYFKYLSGELPLDALFKGQAQGEGEE